MTLYEVQQTPLPSAPRAQERELPEEVPGLGIRAHQALRLRVRRAPHPRGGAVSALAEKE